MSESVKILTFDDAMKQADAAGGKKRILLGNGFSIGAHDLFKYGTLYEQARANGLSEHVAALFVRYGTANFEEVLRNLHEARWLAEHYALQKTDPALDMTEDYESLRQSLVQAIADNHPSVPDAVGNEKLSRCTNFLLQFDDVYTTNYDLLLYWASIADGSFPFQDGFGREEDTDESYCIHLPSDISSGRHIYFLHGALHLYSTEGEVRKMVWSTTGIPLMGQVEQALDENHFPLIVSEGSSVNKGERIEASSYLSWCHRRIARIGGSLFVYGSALSDEDGHIWDWIAADTDLPRLFVGIFGDPSSDQARSVISRALQIAEHRKEIISSGKTGVHTKKLDLDVVFYDSETANVWQPASPYASEAVG